MDRSKKLEQTISQTRYFSAVAAKHNLTLEEIEIVVRFRHKIIKSIMVNYDNPDNKDFYDKISLTFFATFHLLDKYKKKITKL